MLNNWNFFSGLPKTCPSPTLSSRERKESTISPLRDKEIVLKVISFVQNELWLCQCKTKYTTLSGTARRILLIYSFSGNSAASAPISTFMCLWAIYMYSPRIGIHISSSRIGRPIVGIYKSLTDSWMWKLGLRPRYFFSGNICFEISVFCLCSGW